MSFDKNSNFNREANFTGVKFGENKPVLEVELNELQEIQNEARADIVRDSIPSGFVQLGDLDFEYMKNNENQVKLKTDSVAYVNGYKINIPKDTIINIGKAPEKEAREDLLFLEVWKEEVTSDSVLTKNGGEGQVEIPNKIKDDRYPIETSHRVALKWRIRHVADVDFSFSDGLGVDYTSKANYKVQAQGGNSEPLAFTDPFSGTSSYYKFSAFWSQIMRDSAYAWANAKVIKKDVGLFVAGEGSNTSKSILKTVDGFVYAIPMFKLYRKPSCGKSIPFEYDKINPKVDYKKFAKLMKEERVERVEKETIGGKSLLNLLADYSSTSETYYIVSKKLIGVKALTDYTIIFDLKVTSKGTYNGNLSVSIENEPYFSDVDVPFTSGKYICKYTTKGEGNSASEINYSKDISVCFWALSTNLGQRYSISNIIVLEGDWTNKKIPEYFTGLKSLGEDDNNLVTVKNSILEENAFDPCEENVVLDTYSTTTYFSSENSLIPTIEANVKRGESTLSTLNAFGKIETEGDEKIEITKVKGRTLQNLLDKDTFYNTSKWNGTNGQFSLVSNKGYVTLTANGGFVNGFILLNNMFKPSTKYTIVMDIKENSLSKEMVSGFVLCGSSSMEITTEGKNSSNCDFTPGTKKILITTKEDLSSCSYSLRSFIYSGIMTGKIVYRVTILEGDHTNTPIEDLPFGEGIYSVGEAEKTEDGRYKISGKSCGKNLFNLNKLSIWVSDVDINNNSFIVSAWAGRITEDANFVEKTLKPNTKYTISFNLKLIKNNTTLPIYNYQCGTLFYNLDTKKNFGSCCTKNLTTNGDTETLKWTFTTPSDLKNYQLLFYTNGYGNSGVTEKDSCLVTNFMIEESSTKTDSEPYKEMSYSYVLNEPLRSLPNGTMDTIEGNKVIRRIGKLVLDGTETYSLETSLDRTHNYLTMNATNIPFKVKDVYVFNDQICDRLKVANCYEKPLCAWLFYNLSSKVKSLRISSSNSLATKEDLVNWIKNNPLTIYYELAQPVEEDLVHYYDRETMKTYQLDAPLRSLPSGVRDEIVGDTLIRRCGEIILDGTENWNKSDNEELELTTFFYVNIEGKASNTSDGHLCDKFRYNGNAMSSMGDIECYGTYTSNPKSLNIRILKTKLSENSVSGFKAWLQANPVKVIYELTTPVEIKLKEVSPQTADFSYERQLSEGNYLRELPNGVKDTIENGKVVRRIKRMYLTGSENWLASTNGTNVKRFYLADVGLKNYGDSVVNVLSTIPTFTRVDLYSSDVFGVSSCLSTASYSKGVVIAVESSKLSTQDVSGFKAWLQANPVTVLFELNTPTEEALTTENSTYFPYHEVNTYCGSLYVGEGNNHVECDNKMVTDEIVINTPFREIVGKEIITDCRYKKCEDGYDTKHEISVSSNLLKQNFELGNISSVNGGNSVDSTMIRNIDYSYVLPNTEYLIDGVTSKNNIALRFYDVNKSIIGHKYSTAVPYSFTTPKNCYYVRALQVGNTNVNSKIKLTINNGDINYEDYVPGEMYFENLDSNSIEDLRHQVSLTGFNYDQLLNDSFDKLLRGEL